MKIGLYFWSTFFLFAFQFEYSTQVWAGIASSKGGGDDRAQSQSLTQPEAANRWTLPPSFALHFPVVALPTLEKRGPNKSVTRSVIKKDIVVPPETGSFVLIDGQLAFGLTLKDENHCRLWLARSYSKYVTIPAGKVFYFEDRYQGTVFLKGQGEGRLSDLSCAFDKYSVDTFQKMAGDWISIELWNYPNTTEELIQISK
jgi:hypothetical protein